jgi:hypothetical protein
LGQEQLRVKIGMTALPLSKTCVKQFSARQRTKRREFGQLRRKEGWREKWLYGMVVVPKGRSPIISRA